MLPRMLAEAEKEVEKAKTVITVLADLPLSVCRQERMLSLKSAPSTHYAMPFNPANANGAQVASSFIGAK